MKVIWRQSIAAISKHDPCVLNYIRTAVAALFALCTVVCIPNAAADEPLSNAVADASDAFGRTEGRESIGLYNPYYVRGFSPVSAGNVRIDGLYFSPLGGISKHVVQSSAIEVGLSAMDDAFPAPTGIANYHLRSDRRGEPGRVFTVFAGPYEARGVDLDSQLHLTSAHLFVPFGATYQTGASLPDYTSQLTSFGLAPIWNPTEAVTVQGFWDRQQTRHIKPVPILFTSGNYLPPSSAAQIQPLQWTDSDSLNENRGMTIRARVRPEWSLAAGVFQAVNQSAASYSDLYLEIQPDGTADHQVVREANQRSQITSGETQLRWRRNSKHGRHGLTLSVRAREISTRFGNSDTVDFGRGALGGQVPISAPHFATFPQTEQRTQSWTTGLSYRETWTNWGQVALGVQKVLYHEDVSPPDDLRVTRSESPWLLYTSAKLSMSSRVTFFTSYTQGLEDSGVAPSTAANRGAILEVARTHQGEIGLRYAPSASTSVLVSAFDILKPYVNLDDANVYRTLGVQQNKGVEFSLSTKVGEGLHVVAGAVLNHIRVSSDAVAEFRSSTAFGQPNTHAILNLDYGFQHLRGLSLDLGVTYTGATPASTDSTFQIPPTTVLDVGAKVRFKLLNSSATLRIQAQNVASNTGWNVGLSPGFTEYPPRRVLAYLTVSI